ncbi:MAG: hypothetical protein ACTTJ7_04850 [Treponema sp.]
MKKNSRFIFFLLYGIYCASFGFTDGLIYTKPQTASLDIDLSKVAVIIAPFDGSSIAYRYEAARGKKPSCIETYRTLRIRAMTPAEGTLYLFIPKKHVLESCTIHINGAALTIEGLQAAHVLITANGGSVTLTQSAIKSAVLTVARSTLALDLRILGSCALSMSASTADIAFEGTADQYHLDYMHSNSSFTIDSTQYPQSPGEYGNPKSKRRLIISAGSSQAAVRFIPQEK